MGGQVGNQVAGWLGRLVGWLKVEVNVNTALNWVGREKLVRVDKSQGVCREKLEGCRENGKSLIGREKNAMVQPHLRQHQ